MEMEDGLTVRRKNPFSKFLVQIVIGVSVLILLGLIITFTINRNLVRDALYDHVVGITQRDKTLNFREIDTWFYAAGQTVKAFASALQSLPDAEHFPEMAARFMEDNDFIKNVFIGFADATMIDSAGWGSYHEWPLQDRLWFTEAQRAGPGQLVTTPPYISPYTDNLTAVKAVWLPDLLGQGASVGFWLELSFMLDKLDNHLKEGGSELILVCSRGEVLLHPNADYRPQPGRITHLSEVEDGPFFVDSIAAGESFFSMKDANRDDAYVMITQLAITDWMLIEIIPADVTRYPVYRELDNIMLMLVITFGVLSMLAASMISFLMLRLDKWQMNDEKLRISIARKQASDRAKHRFLTNMSHEIRTPMNAILSMSHFALQTPDTVRKDDFIDKINAASNQLLLLINQLFDISQIENDVFTLVEQPFEFNKMISGIISSCGLLAKQKDIRFTTDIDKTIPHAITGDERRLAQVITNLLSNAIKFTPPNGHVRLEAKIVPEQKLRIAVSDTGAGIPLEEQDRVFEAFEQQEEARHAGSGMGLGLAICKKIVDMMDGEIGLESKEGEGTTIIITVPLLPAEIESPAEEAEAEVVVEDEPDPFGAGCFKGHTILLVEDIEINREIVLTLMEDTGAEIVCAENGEEAVQIYKADPKRFALILMDLQMPVMDGYEATRQIRALDSQIPIIAVTANVLPADIDACFAVGMNDHLPKPLNFALVLETIAHHLPQ